MNVFNKHVLMVHSVYIFIYTYTKFIESNEKNIIIYLLIIAHCVDHKIVIAGILRSDPAHSPNRVFVERPMPNMDIAI